MNKLIKLRNSNKMIDLSFLDKILGKDTIYKEIDGGSRCFTLRVNENNNKKTPLIIQIYEQQLRYQAYKKFSIYQLVSNCTNVPVPYVFDVGETAEYSYIIMQDMPGKRLSLVKRKPNFNMLEIMANIGKILSDIHTKVNVKNSYGWLEKEGIIKPYNNFVDYLNSEIERFSISLYDQLEEQVRSDIIIKALNAVNHIESYKHSCSLVWFDIHPDNILVTKKDDSYVISGWLDPGASRVGSGAWDLAYVKFEFDNQEQFQALKNEYTKVSHKVFEDSLIDAFFVLVAIDVLILALGESWNDLAKKSLNLLFNQN